MADEKNERRYVYAELGEMLVNDEWGFDLTAKGADATLHDARMEDEATWMIAALLRLARPVLLREKAKIKEECFRAIRQIQDAGKSLWIAWEEEYGRIEPRHCRAYVEERTHEYVRDKTKILLGEMMFEQAVREVRGWASGLSPWNLAIEKAKAPASYRVWVAWCEGKYAPKKNGD